MDRLRPNDDNGGRAAKQKKRGRSKRKRQASNKRENAARQSTRNTRLHCGSAERIYDSNIPRDGKYVVVLCARSTHAYVYEPHGKPDNRPDIKTSDDLRVWALTQKLKGSARVITVNKKDEENNDLHIDIDFRAPWAPRFNAMILQAKSTITDVFLDYFFYLKTVFSKFIGMQFLFNVSQLNFTGVFYLPMPIVDEATSPEDYAYVENFLSLAKTEAVVLETRHDIDSIPYCRATIAVTEQLEELNAARVHDFQVMG